MVLPAKVFELRAEADHEVLEQRLKNFREEEPYESEERGAVNLLTEILDLKLEEDRVSGVFCKDFINRRYYRRKIVETAITEEANFWIKSLEGRTFLIVLAPSVARGVKKLLTNHVANKLSEIIFNAPGMIVEVRIPHETLRDLHESNPQATKLIWFDDVDIPSVEKLCLAGSGLADTHLYKEYLEHGNIWYVVFEVQKHSIVIGITRSCVVTLFSKSDGGIVGFVEIIIESILPLV